MDILLLFSVPQISCPIRTACFLWSIATQHFMPLKKVSLGSLQPYNFFVRHFMQKYGKYGFRLLCKFIVFIMSVIRPVRWQHLQRLHKSYFDTCPPDYTIMLCLTHWIRFGYFLSIMKINSHSDSCTVRHNLVLYISVQLCYVYKNLKPNLCTTFLIC
jgi:hypothetical protein